MTHRCVPSDFLGELDEIITLDRHASHHAANVLRLKKGELIELKDGRGGWGVARVEDPCSRAFQVRIVELVKKNAESPLSITLCMAFARSDRMDAVVRQATELGVSGLVGFRSQRSQYGLSSGQWEKRRERWRRICLEAICQCGRTSVPHIDFFEDLKALAFALESRGGANVFKLLACEDVMSQKGSWSSQSFGDLAGCQVKEAVVLVGPEGGWAIHEVEFLKERGFLPVWLGPRVLRFETAVVAVLTISQFLWGDMGKSLSGG